MTEVIEVMEEAEARRRVSRICTGLEDIYDDVIVLHRGQGWLALGYDTWAELCAAEFPLRPALQREERRELVEQLTEAGLSTRAQAEVIGVSKDTIQRDQTTVSNETVERPQRVTGLDGREYSRPEPGPFVLNDSSGDLRRRERNRVIQQALSKAWGFQQYDPEEAAEVMEDVDWKTLDHLIQNLESWRDRARAARQQTLAVVKEFRQ